MKRNLERVGISPHQSENPFGRPEKDGASHDAYKES
jgi:hypothetical protein